MSDTLSEAVDLLMTCLASQDGTATGDPTTGGDAGAAGNPPASGNLNVWAVVDARECGGECPVRYRVAQEAGNQFGRILSAHLALELGFLRIACQATGSEPDEVIRHVLAEAREQWERAAEEQEAADDDEWLDDDPDDPDDPDDADAHDDADTSELSVVGPAAGEFRRQDGEPAGDRYSHDMAGLVPDGDDRGPDSGHVSARHRMLLDHGDRTI